MAIPNDDLTTAEIDAMKRQLHYLEYAQGLGDQAHMEHTTFEDKVVITIKKKRKAQ